MLRKVGGPGRGLAVRRWLRASVSPLGVLAVLSWAATGSAHAQTTAPAEKKAEQLEQIDVTAPRRKPPARRATPGVQPAPAPTPAPAADCCPEARRQLDAAQHQCHRRKRKPAGSHAPPNAGDGRGDRPADAQGSRASHHHGGRSSRSRRDGRRCARRAGQLFDARLQRRPDQYALQRHQGRPIRHDEPHYGCRAISSRSSF